MLMIHQFYWCQPSIIFTINSCWKKVFYTLFHSEIYHNTVAIKFHCGKKTKHKKSLFWFYQIQPMIVSVSHWLHFYRQRHLYVFFFLNLLFVPQKKKVLNDMTWVWVNDDHFNFWVNNPLMIVVLQDCVKKKPHLGCCPKQTNCNFQN